MGIQDIRTGVRRALEESHTQAVEDHDVDGIVEEIGTTYGYDLQSVDQVPTEEFWAIVQRHAKPSPEREMAAKWLENHVHRSMWQIMTAADAMVAELQDKINPDDPSAEDLEKLDRLQGKAEGIQEMVDLCLRAWLLDRQAGGMDVSLIWPEIENLCPAN